MSRSKMSVRDSGASPPLAFRHVGQVIGLTVPRYQILLTGTALLISAVQWFLAGRGSWWSTLIYTFASGNSVALIMGSLLPLYRVSFPSNWARYLLLLLPVAVFASFVGGVANRILLGLPLSSLFEWRHGDLPYAALISYSMGVIIFAFASARMRMEDEKKALAQQVQFGQAAMKTHEAELKAAFEIQSGLLPKTIPTVPGVEISCAWEPARTVSGDYFQILHLGPERLGFCLADVSGKGMGAALVTANLHAAFRAFALDGTSPASVCERLHEALCESLPVGKFVTLIYGVLDRQRMHLTYEVAGHNAPLLLRNSGLERLHGSGPVLGVFPGASFTNYEITLASNDLLILATDGITEAVQPGGDEEFGEERLAAAASHLRNRNAHLVRTEVMSQVTAFAEGQFHDDASLMVIVVTQQE